MKEIKIPFSTLILLMMLIVIVIYTFNLKSSFNEQKAKNTASSDVAAAQEVNAEFIKKFFTYRSLKDRYSEVKSLMTPKGYEEFEPDNLEGMEDGNITSKMAKLKSYPGSSEKNVIEIYNEFNVVIMYEGDKSEQPVTAKTKLAKDKSGKWKVDQFQILNQESSSEEDHDHD